MAIKTTAGIIGTLVSAASSAAKSAAAKSAAAKSSSSSSSASRQSSYANTAAKMSGGSSSGSGGSKSGGSSSSVNTSVKTSGSGSSSGGASSTGGTYKVGADGKAPSGLSVGDNVVTGDGTYKITGVNADRTYQSTKINDISTSTYTGSYANVPSGGSSSGSGSNAGAGVGGKTYTSAPSTNGKSYSVTSATGVNFIENAKAGETMTGGDGSKWTKNADGTTTIVGGTSGSVYTIPAASGGNSFTGGVYRVGADGKAPSGLSVGDNVVTGDGTYKITGVNADRTYQSTKISDISTSTYTGNYDNAPAPAEKAPYKPIGDYNAKGVSRADSEALEALDTQYAYNELMEQQARAVGDMEKAEYYAAQKEQNHLDSEAILAKYGFSGGPDGSQFILLPQEENTIPKIGLPDYEPQEEQVNEVYDAAAESAKATLKTAYDNSRLDMEAARARIDPIYAAQRNALAAENEIEKANFREMAAGSGLNVGAGAQAQLAYSNLFMNNMTANRNAQATAEANAELELTKLYTNYQNSIAEAVAKNDYERAAALLAEYQTAAKSIVDVAQAQANLDLQVADFNRETSFSNRDYEQQKAMTEAEAARQAQLDEDARKQQAWENAYNSAWDKLEAGNSSLTAEELSATGLSAQEAKNIAYNYLMQMKGLWG